MSNALQKYLCHILLDMDTSRLIIWSHFLFVLARLKNVRNPNQKTVIEVGADISRGPDVQLHVGVMVGTEVVGTKVGENVGGHPTNSIL